MIVKKVWQHTIEGSCNRCGKHISIATTKAHNVTVVEREDGQYNLWLCPSHQPRRLVKWLQQELLDNTPLIFLKGLHQ